MAKPVI
jgi:hypothetical protein